MVTHTEKGLFWGSATPPPYVGRSLSSSEFSSIYAYTLCRWTTKYDVVTHVGEERVSWVQICLPFQQSRVPVLPNFGVLLYLCRHPLTQNDHIQHGNTFGERRVLRSATPLHLHKCVARFVSDSWLSCFILCSIIRLKVWAFALSLSLSLSLCNNTRAATTSASER